MIREFARWIFRNVEIYDFSIKLYCEEAGTQDFVLIMADDNRPDPQRYWNNLGKLVKKPRNVQLTFLYLCMPVNVYQLCFFSLEKDIALISKL